MELVMMDQADAEAIALSGVADKLTRSRALVTDLLEDAIGIRQEIYGREIFPGCAGVDGAILQALAAVYLSGESRKYPLPAKTDDNPSAAEALRAHVEARDEA